MMMQKINDLFLPTKTPTPVEVGELPHGRNVLPNALGGSKVKWGTLITTH